MLLINKNAYTTMETNAGFNSKSGCPWLCRLKRTFYVPRENTSTLILAPMTPQPATITPERQFPIEPLKHQVKIHKEKTTISKKDESENPRINHAYMTHRILFVSKNASLCFHLVSRNIEPGLFNIPIAFVDAQGGEFTVPRQVRRFISGR
jgi:hypothetical protein